MGMSMKYDTNAENLTDLVEFVLTSDLFDVECLEDITEVNQGENQ